MNLPIVNDCDNCGACCFEQGSPPGYLVIMSGSAWAPVDVRRFAKVPAEAKAEIEAYRKALIAGTVEGNGDGPCCWLDRSTNRCRWYEHRPSICRELEPGSDGCHTWRAEYNIDVEALT